MGRIAAPTIALVLGVAVALALVSCGGGSSSDLLPGATAQQITANLDKVQQLAASGDCTGAEEESQQVSEQIDDLGGVDKQLKQALRKGAARLSQVVADCTETTSAETVAPSAPVEPTTTSEQTAKKPPKKKEQKPEQAASPTTSTPTATTPTTSTTTPTTTTPTVPPTTPVPPTTGGGTGAPSGGVGTGSPASGSP